jgi:hypothetical protein
VISALALASFMVISAQFGGVAALAGVVAAMGFAMGAHRPMGTYFQLGFFGLKTFGTIVGVQSPFLAIAMGVAPLLVGWCYDAYGTYQPAFIVIALCAGATVLIYLMLGPYRFAAKPTPALAQPAQPGDEKAVRPA